MHAIIKVTCIFGNAGMIKADKFVKFIDRMKGMVKNMQSSVKIMGIDIDMLSNDVFIEKINEYLKDDKMDVILFASADMINHAAEDDKYHEIIDKAELFLPGEEALLTNYKVDMLEAGGMVVSCKSFGVMLENLWKQDRVIYIVADSEEDVENLRNYCKKNQPELKVAGDCVYSEEVEDAAIVNEINSCTPDILLVDLESSIQEKWIIEHVKLLNAKICIAIGGVAGIIMAEEKKVPVWIEKIGLTKLYEKFAIERIPQKFMKAKFFSKRIDRYNTKNDQ